MRMSRPSTRRAASSARERFNGTRPRASCTKRIARRSRRMRIGIDARELGGRATGVGRYLAGLLQQWTTSDRARRHEFVLYAPDTIAMRLDTRRFATRAVAGSGGTAWEQIHLPAAARRDHLDVWF